MFSAPRPTNENVFFLRAEKFCNRPVYTCSPDDTVAHAARTMNQAGVSSLVVCKGRMPVGIVTDRDFREKIIARELSPSHARISQIMTEPLVTLGEEDYLFEAFYLMTRHNIHRVAVVDAEGALKGLVTDSDLLRLQVGSPQFLIRDIENAHSIAELKTLFERAGQFVKDHFETGIKTMDLVRLISYIHDAIVLRLIDFLRKEEFSDLKGRFAFIVLGSEGRMEQTLKTDQDNAMILANDLTEGEKERLAAFSQRLIDAIIEIGVPPCPGGIMAKNEFWRQSLATWRERVWTWTTEPLPENLLKFSMFSDVRLLYGDEALVRDLKAYVRKMVRENEVFAVYMARNILRFTPPIGWFGHFKFEKEGEHRGQMDIKKGGIFPITEGVKLLALTTGAEGMGTWERIGALGEAGTLTHDEALELQTSYSFLVFLRLRSQIHSIQQGNPATDYIDAGHLNVVERHRLRVALETVESFQSYIKTRFHLDLMR